VNLLDIDANRPRRANSDQRQAAGMRDVEAQTSGVLRGVNLRLAILLVPEMNLHGRQIKVKTEDNSQRSPADDVSSSIILEVKT